MKTHKKFLPKSGFTLMELMVAMAITTIIVTVLVSITSIALDTWNRSRAELRASRQGKAMVDSMAKDFESLVTRRGNANEWLSAISATTAPGTNLKSTNACDLIFFTAATDRYDGKIGDSTVDKGGDISCTSYALQYTDPITGSSGNFDTFVLNRYLVNPDVTFENLLGKPDLSAAFSSYATTLRQPENFVCENIYQFSLTFHIQVATTGTGTNATTTYKDVPITVGSTSSGQVTNDLRIKGTGIVASVSGGDVTSAQLQAGRLTGVEISVTVISDFGIDQLRNRSDLNGNKQSDFLAKNSYQYSKLVQVPSM